MQTTSTQRNRASLTVALAAPAAVLMASRGIAQSWDRSRQHKCSRLNQFRALAILLPISLSCAKPIAIDADAVRMPRLASSALPQLATERYSHALAGYACGPTDGPALALYLL